MDRVTEIIQDRLDDEVEELDYLEYRKSLGWKNRFPIFHIPMSMEFIEERLEEQIKEVKKIKLLLNNANSDKDKETLKEDNNDSVALLQKSDTFKSSKSIVNTRMGDTK